MKALTQTQWGMIAIAAFICGFAIGEYGEEILARTHLKGVLEIIGTAVAYGAGLYVGLIALFGSIYLLARIYTAAELTWKWIKSRLGIF